MGIQLRKTITAVTLVAATAAAVAAAPGLPAAADSSGPPPVGGPGAFFGGTMSTCFWYYGAVGGTPDTYNLAYPDAAATYWAAVFRVPAGAKLTLHGEYPHARYTSLTSYDALGQPVDTLADYQLDPDSGSTNPFRPGASRTSTRRSYTVNVLSQKNQNPATGQPLYPLTPKNDQAPRNDLYALANTPYTETVNGKTYQIDNLVLRTYVPDAGTDLNGNVPMPEPELTLADGSTLTGQALCDMVDSQSKDRIANGLGTRLPDPTSLTIDAATYQALRHPETLSQPCNVLAIGCPTTGLDSPAALVQVPRPIADPSTFPATNPAEWRTQYDRRYLLQMYTGDKAPGAETSPTRAGGGGFFPNPHNNYIRAALNRNFGDVVVLHGKLPTSPRTSQGETSFPTGTFQDRYTSFCMNESVATTKVMDCLSDEQIPTDANGWYTIVISRSGDRPTNATASCGRAWLGWSATGDGAPAPNNDPNFGWLQIRNMLPDPSFAQAIQNTTHPGDEKAVMGDYLPSVTYMSTAQAESAGCHFSGIELPGRTHTFQRGRTIPVKFELTDPAGRPVDGATATLDIAPINNDSIGTYTPALATVGKTNAFRNLGHGNYLFNLSTRQLSVGNWSLRVTLKDGTQYTADITVESHGHGPAGAHHPNAHRQGPGRVRTSV